MLRIFTTLLALIIISSCSVRQVQVVNPEEISRQILIFAEKLKYEFHLDLDDSCIYYESHVNRIRLQFSSMDTLYLSDARKLLVDLVEDFVGRINKNEEIAPYLGPNGFGPENLEIYICFISFYNRFVDTCTVGLITLRGGITHIVASDITNCDLPCWSRRREYYWQSRSFVSAQREGEALYKPKPKKKKEYLRDERYYPVDINI